MGSLVFVARKWRATLQYHTWPAVRLCETAVKAMAIGTHLKDGACRISEKLQVDVAVIAMKHARNNHSWLCRSS